MIVLLFRLYRSVFSPDTGIVSFCWPGGCCRFYPSCSRYAEDLINKRGVMLALPGIAWRLLRCNPWNLGGYDPVEENRPLENRA